MIETKKLYPVRMEPSLKRQADKAARQSNMRLAEFIRAAIRMAVEKVERKSK